MPLLFDMPREDLFKYQGTNPCPKDFDSYWDNAITEMKSVSPNVELILSDFQVPYADCYDMYFTGVKNARIHAQLIRPKNIDKPSPAVLMFHGYTANACDWHHKLAYAAMGYTVAAMDCRGQGGMSEDTGNVLGNTFHGHIIRGLDGPSDNMLFRHIFLDTAELAKIIMDLPEVDNSRVCATGVSQGGGLTLACASLVPEIKLAAIAFPFLCDYQRIWELDLAENAYEELKQYFRFFDPQHKREKEIFEKLGYIDVQHLTKRIKAKIVMASSFQDKICPPSTQFAAYNKIRSEKSHIIYPDFEHEDLPGFFDRVFQEIIKI
ncbi:MAG TPA: acetylxylan esterase [Victivallales bacterium]|nr:acetylxylan esterase [Victivallales bacterium]